MIFKMSWRNIWRNRRRTLITMASILFAVLFSSFMEALQKGAWGNMINNVVNFYYGYAQVHQKGYWDDRTLDKAFEWTPALQQLPEQVSEIQAVIPRIESFALASTGENTKGALVVGTDPDQEDKMTSLSGRLIEGAYFDSSDKAVLVASGVAKGLDLDLKDTLLLISQGYHGVNAAGKYPIKGIVKFASPDLNKQLVYLPLAEAQWFYGAENRITSLALQIAEQREIDPALETTREILDTAAYELMDWASMMPELLEAKALDSAGNIIVYIILYMIIAFGIFGTILMMTKEREYEFGILISIGMKRAHLAATVWVETVMLGVMGAIAGILVSLPIVYYFKINPIHFSGDYAVTMEKFGFEPIFPALFDWKIFIYQGLIVFLITALLALYPIFKISKLNPVSAMRA